MSRNPRDRRRGSRGEVGRKTVAVVEFVARYAEAISLAVLIVILALGVYIRILPALNYGLELDANDPWIVYWEAKYFHENGLFNFEGLSKVTVFWWPYGRNFLIQEYLGMPWLAAATYPIGEALGLTLKEWVALFPVFAGAASIVLAYLIVRLITGSRLGGLVSAAFFAFLPGAIVRTKAGFVEKTGFALPFLTTFYLFLFLALTRPWEKLRTKVYAVLAGLFGASIAYLWGGFHIVAVSLAIAMLLDPVFRKPDRETLERYLVIAASYIIFTLPSPKIGLQYFLTGIGASVTIALAIYAFEAYIERIPVLADIVRPGPRLQLWIIAVLAVAAVVAVQSNFFGVSNRLLAAVGIRHLSPLVESVQENQPVTMKFILKEYGIALLLTLAGAGVLIAKLVSGRYTSQWALPRAILYFMALFMVFANKQLAYFSQAAAFFNSIAAGFAVSDLVEGVLQQRSERRGRAEAGDSIRILTALLIIVVVLVGGIYYANNSYTVMAHQAPQILTSGLGSFAIRDPATGDVKIIVPINNAWLNALDWINENTPEDALIVSWWDYGYWITVNTGRKTLADGATINETQIRFLARILTGDEAEATYILKNVFHAEPGKTYIVFYEVFRAIINTNNNASLIYPLPSISNLDPNGRIRFIAHGSADFQKSAQMLRIAYKVDPFRSILESNYTTFTVDALGGKWYHFPGFTGEPKKNVDLVRSGLIYRMAINGIAALPSIAVYDNATCGDLPNNMKTTLMGVVSTAVGGQVQFDYLLPSPMRHFEPVAVSVACPMVETYGEGYVATMVIVFIYQWTG